MRVGQYTGRGDHSTGSTGSCYTTIGQRLRPIEQVERDTIIKALQDVQGNHMRAAEPLGMARSFLYRKIKRYGITGI